MGAMDVVDAKTRSRMMSRIRSKDTKPELMVRRFLHSRGFRFRLNVKALPGSPDLVLPKFQLVIFVHGCYWHRHPGCHLATTPATNPERWQAKFDANVARDRRNLAALNNVGWRTLVIWECGLRNAGTQALTWLPDWIRGGDTSWQWPSSGEARLDLSFDKSP